MTVLPVHEVTRPSCLTGQANGRLAASILVGTPGLGGGPTVMLVKPAARSWRAMTARALADGLELRATSRVDSYRPYEVQERIFRERYTTSFLAGRPWRMWNGQRWYQKPNTAAAAVPGTSNHGRAIAVDVAINPAVLDWLLANAERFGWSWEIQSENWHIRYVAGDVIPAVVLAYEAGQQQNDEGDDMPDKFMVPDPWSTAPTPGRQPHFLVCREDGDKSVAVARLNGATFFPAWSEGQRTDAFDDFVFMDLKWRRFRTVGRPTGAGVSAAEVFFTVEGTPGTVTLAVND